MQAETCADGQRRLRAISRTQSAGYELHRVRAYLDTFKDVRFPAESYGLEYPQRKGSNADRLRAWENVYRIGLGRKRCAAHKQAGLRPHSISGRATDRSEERRVGKQCR